MTDVADRIIAAIEGDLDSRSGLALCTLDGDARAAIRAAWRLAIVAAPAESTAVVTDDVTVTLPRRFLRLTCDVWTTADLGGADDVACNIADMDADELSDFCDVAIDLARMLDEPSAPSTAVALTPRGFGEYGTVTDVYGDVITVRQSSAMGGPYVHIFTRDADGHRCVPCVGAPDGGWSPVSPHLDVAQARELIAALQRFVDDEAHAAARAP